MLRKQIHDDEVFSVRTQIEILNSLPQPFTIRDLDYALHDHIRHWNDGRRSKYARRLIESWIFGKEIASIGGPGITRYQVGRKAA